jgi:hypothetical protein
VNFSSVNKIFFASNFWMQEEIGVP